MLNYMGKIFTIIMVFLMIVIAPICNHFVNEDGVSRLLVLNEMTLFLDKVCDKGTITEHDLDELYNDLNSHGFVMDVDVNRMIRVSFTEADGELKESYIKADEAAKGETIELNQHDVVQIHAYEIIDNPARRILYQFTHIDNKGADFTLAKTVR